MVLGELPPPAKTGICPWEYGGTAAAVRLAELGLDRHVMRPVKAVLQHYERLLATLNTIPDVTQRLFLLHLLRDDTLRRVDKLSKLPTYARALVRSIVYADARRRVMRPMGLALRPMLTARERRLMKRAGVKNATS